MAMPCCSKCKKCGERIKWPFENLSKHELKCDGKKTSVDKTLVCRCRCHEKGSGIIH